MEKFLVTSESATKEQLVDALATAKVEATVLQHKADVLVLEFSPVDVPESDKHTPEENMETLCSFENDLYLKCMEILGEDNEVVEEVEEVEADPDAAPAE